MSNFQFSDCKKAVNQALFRPTADRKAAAIKALQEALELVTNLEEVKDKPKASKTKKRRRKTTKRTPSQKVADHMDKASMKTNEVGPVKPSKKAKTASVKEAKASLKEMDAKNKAKNQSKIEALTQCLAMHMETTSLPSAIEDSNNVPF